MYLSCTTAQKIQVTFQASDADSTAAVVLTGAGTVTDTGTDKLTFIAPDVADTTEYLVTSTVSAVARSIHVTLVSYAATPTGDLSVASVGTPTAKP